MVIAGKPGYLPARRPALLLTMNSTVANATAATCGETPTRDESGRCRRTIGDADLIRSSRLPRGSALP